jgi:hypothetical protein
MATRTLKKVYRNWVELQPSDYVIPTEFTLLTEHL